MPKVDIFDKGIDVNFIFSKEFLEMKRIIAHHLFESSF